MNARSGYWWTSLALAGLALALALGALAFVAVALLGFDERSPTVAAVAELRDATLDVASAADVVRAGGDPAQLDDAIAALDAQRATLAGPVVDVLGENVAASHLQPLDASLEEFARLARDFAAGTEGVGSGGASFADANDRIDMLVTALADRSAADSAAARSRALSGTIVLGLAALLAFGESWRVHRRLHHARERQLAHAEQRDELAGDLPLMLFESTADGLLTLVNGSPSMLLGYTRGELTGRTLAELGVAMPDFAPHSADTEDAADPEVRTTEQAWRHANGSSRPLHTIMRAVRDAEGRLVAVRGVLRDLSEQRAAEHALRESEERFRTVLETAQNGIMVVSADGRIELSNGALQELLGYGADELRGMPVRELVHGRSADRTVELVAQPIWSEERRSRRRERFVQHGGGVLDVDLSLSPFRRQDRVVGVLIEVRDITESKRAEETIERLAYVDELTGLPNRAAVQRTLGERVAAAEGGSELAVLLFDLDQFKLVNDSLGHHAGDGLLHAVAQRLRARLPARHDLARLGGDEFLLVADTDAAGAAALAGDVLDALDEPFAYEGHELHVGASVGISLYPEDGADGETLVRRADTAMYRAKALGRNTFQRYNPAMERDAHGRFGLHGEVHRALHDAEFVLHYQPLLDAGGERIVGAEALLRWQHPERGLVPPAEFVPLLEEAGLIAPVGSWALREACTQARRWNQGRTTALRVAVNLSAAETLQPDLVELVARTLESTGLPPELLTLEISETAVAQHLDDVVPVLRDLRELGVTTALDGFGAGTTSLTQLRRLSVGRVKIDRAFVRDAVDDEGARTIVGGVVAMGHALGLDVAAAGVETDAQWALLRDLECDVVQGFYFDAPLEPGEFERRLDELAQPSGSAA